MIASTGLESPALKGQHCEDVLLLVNDENLHVKVHKGLIVYSRFIRTCLPKTPNADTERVNGLQYLKRERKNPCIVLQS